MNTASYVVVMLAMFVTVSLVVDRLLRNLLPVSLQVFVCAAVSVPLYQLFVYLDLGYVEPYYMVAILVQVPVAMVVALCTLVVLRHLRQRRG